MDAGDDRGFARRPVDRPGTQRGRDHTRPLGQQLADVQLGFRPALHTDDDEAAVVAECVDVAVEVERAHDVEDDVRAAGVTDDLDEIVVVVVDGDLGAEFGAQVEFVGRPRGDGDPAVQRAGDLDGMGADAAGAAVDEQQLTGSQAGGHHQVRPHRAGDLRQTRGVR